MKKRTIIAVIIAITVIIAIVKIVTIIRLTIIVVGEEQTQRPA